MSVLLLLLGAAALLALLVAYRNRRRNALLARIPGPVFVPVFGSMLEFLFRVVWKGRDIIEVGTELTAKFGPVIKIWTGHLPYVMVCSAADTEAVLTRPAVADKGLGYQLIAKWLGDGLLLAGGEKWHARRKMIAPAFGVRVLDQFAGVFDRQAAVLEGKLRHQVGQPPFNVVPYMTLCTLDVISETAMGVQINAQTQADSDYVRAVKTACECFFLRQVYPWLHFESLLRLSAVGARFADAITVLHGLTHKVIRQRKAEMKIEMADLLPEQEDDVGLKQRVVLLDHLLSKSLRGEGVVDQDILDEVNTFLFAGHDTTTTSLCFTLHLLSKHPEVQDAVHREVRDVVGGEGPVEPRHLPELRYLECVIKESLRLYPSVPTIVRNCTREFTLPSGYTIPAGTQVGINIVHLHRDPELFPKPESFDPDRFLPDRAEGRHHSAYIPFSASQRNCIGQKFAMMEMKTVLARLVRAFRIRPPRDDYKLRIKAEIVLAAHGGILVQLEERAPSAP